MFDQPGNFQIDNVYAESKPPIPSEILNNIIRTDAFIQAGNIPLRKGSIDLLHPNDDDSDEEFKKGYK